MECFCHCSEDVGPASCSFVQNSFASSFWTRNAPNPHVKSTTSIAETRKKSQSPQCYDQTAQNLRLWLLPRKGPRRALLILRPTVRHPFVCAMAPQAPEPGSLVLSAGGYQATLRCPPCHWMDASATAAAIATERLWFWGRVGGRWL